MVFYNKSLNPIENELVILFVVKLFKNSLKLIKPKKKLNNRLGFLDENNNGRLDKNVLGVPLEKYAISNDVRERFSAPSFEKAAVINKRNRILNILSPTQKKL